VQRFKIGDEVYARPDKDRIGTFAELIAVNEADLAIKPSVLTMEEAAAVPLVALTAWQALVEKAALKKGQKVFIQAGSGGVGTIAIQLAKHLGATVATTTGTANIDWVKELGADIVIDYKKEDFEAVLRDYDVVLKKAKRRGLQYSFLFMRANGSQLSEITSLINAGAIRPVMDKVFPFESIKEAMAYVEKGRAKGKVVVKFG
jgi:alcohol dehydrogenase